MWGAGRAVLHAGRGLYLGVNATAGKCGVSPLAPPGVRKSNGPAHYDDLLQKRYGVSPLSWLTTGADAYLLLDISGAMNKKIPEALRSGLAPKDRPPSFGT